MYFLCDVVPRCTLWDLLMSEQEDPGFRLGWKVVSFPLTKLENARGGGGLRRKYEFVLVM